MAKFGPALKCINEFSSSANGLVNHSQMNRFKVHASARPVLKRFIQCARPLARPLDSPREEIKYCMLTCFILFTCDPKVTCLVWQGFTQCRYTWQVVRVLTLCPLWVRFSLGLGPGPRVQLRYKLVGQFFHLAREHGVFYRGLKPDPV